MNTFMSSQLMPNITPRQKERNSIIGEFRSQKSTRCHFGCVQQNPRIISNVQNATSENKMQLVCNVGSI